MSKRPQTQFVLFDEDHLRLLELQEVLKQRTKLALTLGAIMRLFIRLCPVDAALNVKALEILQDDKRGDWRQGHEKRIYRLSCMLTACEEEKLKQIRRQITPALRARIKKSSMGRLILRSTDNSLIVLHTTREVFFDDWRRREAKPDAKPKRKTR